MEKFLVTSALPYANGPLHIGHIAGAYLPADIFVRYLRLNNKDVIYICGTDEHGAPISIQAEKEGVKPEDIVARFHKSIKESFIGLDIDFDNFSGTARPVHHKIAQKFFLSLLEKDYVNVHSNQQFYCEHCNRFLADRYVEGTCPFCSQNGARGDQCDACGKLMDTITLIEPKCKICHNQPVIKETSHWFLNLPAFQDKLRNWLQSKTYWKENILRFILGLLDEGLKERAITRDIDWGVPVPLEEAEGKVLYVWFDAPIGYISSTIEWAEKIGEPEKWKDYWLNQDTKLIHFIGKDNNVFHAIFWPAVLMGQKEQYVLPHDIPANEFLNLEGQKISTSKNWAIWVNDFLQEFHGDLLRYYLAIIAPESKDSDFNWKEFQDKNNSELSNTLGNLANRVFVFSHKYFAGKVKRPENLSDYSQKTLQEAKSLLPEIDDCYQNYRVRRTTKLIMDIARLGNKYFDERKPWEAVKSSLDGAEETLYVCLVLLKYISIVLYPVIPRKMLELRYAMKLHNRPEWKELEEEPASFEIGESSPLFPRIEDDIISKQLAKLYANAKLNDNDNNKTNINHKDIIDYDDFQKLEIRVAEVLEAEPVPKSDKLLKLRIKIGSEERTVVAGISQYYEPETLIGKKVVILMNLKPRKIFGMESQGMILAASDDKGLSVIVPDKDIPSGSEIS
ncbi:MAG: methionine--tRNA ligase [Candidatus Cloacimonetes bacterium]|nr:methionine--tRNA ligase [Candidatus Cloacimonadota bacterium]